MKYTIEGLNQAQLVEMQLDVTDAFILHWFITFTGYSRIKKRIENDIEYYLIDYQAVLNEFPIFGIKSIKAISMRFDKYGKVTYFSKNDSLLDLEYKRENFENQQENQTSLGFKNTIQNQEEKNQTSFADKENQVPKEVEIHSKRSSIPQQENQTSFALNNPITNSTANINFNIKIPEEKQKIETIVSQMFFGRNPFDALFAEKLIQKFKIYKIELAEDNIKAYLKNIYKLTESKKPSQFTNLFYSLVFSDACFQDFLIKNKIQAKTKQVDFKIICPICQKEHSQYEICDECGFNLSDNQNQQKIKIWKQVYSLPLDKRNSLLLEIDNISSKLKLSDALDEKKLKNKKEAINNAYKKYGINAQEENAYETY